MSRIHTLSRVQRIRKYAIAGGCLLISGMLIVTKPVYSNVYIGWWMETLGILLLSGGFALRLWCTLYIGGRKNKNLMTSGPYSLCRNPLYLGSIIAACGIGMLTKMLTIGILLGFAGWAVFRVVVSKEENYLLKKFGEPYRLYCERTPRFFPRLSGYADDIGPGHFQPANLWDTFRDGLLFFAAIPLIQAIEAAHKGQMLQALFYFY